MAATANPQAGSTVSNPANQGEISLNIYNHRDVNDGAKASVTTDAADWGYAVLTASGNTLVKTGAGQLKKLIVGTAAGNITVYDGTDANGNKILDTCLVPAAGFYEFSVSFKTGLFVVLSGAAVASVTFR